MTRPLQFWVRSQRGRYLLRCGTNLMQQGNLDKAIAVLTVALSKHLKPEEIYLQRGLAHWQQNELDHALADFNEAIALCPHEARAYSHRGLVRYELNNEMGALADWAIALRYQPKDATVRYNRGLVYAQKQQYAEALADFDVALDTNPLLSEAYLHRGKVKHQLDDIPGAVKDWELALCNDLRLDEARQLLTQMHQHNQDATLQNYFQDLLPQGVSVAVEQQGPNLTLMLNRTVGTPINYFKLPNALKERLVKLQLSEVRRFRLIAKAGNSSLSEWDQTYNIYDKVPCPPPHWRAALASTFLLFPPFGVVALVYASQVKQAYDRGDYPIAARASFTVKRLFLSSGAAMGLLLFVLASYGVHTYVEGMDYNPGAKPALLSESETSKKSL